MKNIARILLKSTITPTIFMPKYIYDELNKPLEDDSSVQIREEEIERVKILIKNGREQGLSEMSIKISRELSSKVSANGGAVLEGIPVNASIDATSDSNGDYVMHIKYVELGAIEKLKEIKSLYDNDILTESEFLEAKTKILNSL